MKTLIISFPKSGTYLLSKILQLSGLQPTHWHIGMNSYTNYADADPNIAKSNPHSLNVQLPLKETIYKQPHDTFSVSHLPCNHNTQAILAEVNKIILLRNPYECLCSQMHWELSSKRYLIRKKIQTWHTKTDNLEMLEIFYNEVGSKYINKYSQVLKWVECKNMLVLTYDQLLKNYPVLKSKLIHMFPNVARFEQALKTATQVKTLTKSTQKIDIMQHRSHPIFNDKKLIEIHRSVNNFNTMKHV